MTEPPGLTRARARERRARIDHLRCRLHLAIPPDASSPITGSMQMRFGLREAETPLVVDFTPAVTHLRRLVVNGHDVSGRVEHGHVILPGSALQEGENSVTIDFRAGDAPLHRREALLYSLFVPARASRAFPCFDQPDLKAHWDVSLEVPADWRAVANGAEVENDRQGSVRRVRFARTPPLPTYLVAFAAGRMHVTSTGRDDRAIRLFHVEPDGQRVSGNVDAIVGQHVHALDWMADYTGIPYPFGKLDLVLLPSFQFTGMEHPGAVFYDAGTLLLDAAATPDRHRRRADVIAHETAHMWFGNLVTMPWFDEVWMKEVFAGLMAARIVDASLSPEQRDLEFYVQHYPAAYDLDRTDGAVSVAQPLANLDEAGLVYGTALYHKAPIAMRQLEDLVGSDVLREGLRTYLARHAFGTAGWAELAAALGESTSFDLTAWSRAWIETPGRPAIAAVRRPQDARHAGQEVVLRQHDSRGRGLTWPQRVDVVRGREDATTSADVLLDRAVSQAIRMPGDWTWTLPLGLGRGYGRSALDDESLAWLMAHAHTIGDRRTRAVAHVATWDAMLDGAVDPTHLFAARLEALRLEPDRLVRQLLFAQLRELHWRWMAPAARLAHADVLEDVLRAALGRAADARDKAAWFSTICAVALGRGTVDWLAAVHSGAAAVDGLPLSEADHVRLALELAVRLPDRAGAIVDTQSGRCRHPDHRAQLQFTHPAVSPEPAVRTAFFDSLQDPSRRTREPWVIDALRWLHHPLRAAWSRAILVPGLAMLPEIHRTGDIFLPQRWTQAILSGHRSREAAADVSRFVEGLAGTYPPRLRALVLSAADPLFRAARLAG